MTSRCLCIFLSSLLSLSIGCEGSKRIDTNADGLADTGATDAALPPVDAMGPLAMDHGLRDNGVPDMFVDPTKVNFQIGDGIYPGAWRRVGVGLPRDVDYTFDDLVFEVLEGPSVGHISPSRDDRFDPENPTIILMAGLRLGESFNLVARLEGAEVGRRQFAIVDEWDEAANNGAGPPAWSEGETLGAEDDSPGGPPYGGGGDTPENLNVFGRSAPRNNEEVRTHRVLAVMVEFDDHKFDDPVAEKSLWETALRGNNRSMKTYFNQVSNGLLDLQIAMAGPVKLKGSFAYNHIPSGDRLKPKKGVLFPSCVKAAYAVRENEPELGVDYDFSKVETVICITASNRTPTRADQLDSETDYTWPRHRAEDVKMPKVGGTYNIHYRFIAMPEHWPRGYDKTLDHEMGHALGFQDLYKPKVPDAGPTPGARNLGHWDIMHAENRLPGFSFPLRMMLGWVNANDIQPINAALAPNGFISRRFTLSPSHLPTPNQDDHFLGAEFRFTAGHNLYIEYRTIPPGVVFDQSVLYDHQINGVNPTGAVLITDVQRRVDAAPLVRPTALLAATNPILTRVNQRFEAPDPDGNILKIQVTEMEPDRAEIWVRYGLWPEEDAVRGSNPFIDPYIRTWPSYENAFSSEDLWVRNKITDEDPMINNVPYAKIPNSITARITNGGNEDALGVRVFFTAVDMTVTGSSQSAMLGFADQTQDIPAGQSVEFTLSGWVPEGAGHHCIIAQIADMPNDASRTNNRAQQNYDVVQSEVKPPADIMKSEAKLPAKRAIRSIAVHNPFEHAASFSILMNNRSSNTRSYLEATHLQLQPNETRYVDYMVESIRDLSEEVTQLPEAKVTLTGFVEIPDETPDGAPDTDPHPDTEHLQGGLDILVLDGFATDINAVTNEETQEVHQVSGRVSRSTSGVPVRGGKVVLLGEPVDGSLDWPADTAEVDEQGLFAGNVNGVFHRIHLFFIPSIAEASTLARSRAVLELP